MWDFKTLAELLRVVSYGCSNRDGTAVHPPPLSKKKENKKKRKQKKIKGITMGKKKYKSPKKEEKKRCKSVHKKRKKKKEPYSLSCMIVIYPA